MVKFPQEEQGKLRKLSHPWHGPYRVLTRNDPDVSVAKAHTIQVHQERVCFCPPEFPAGYFWYGRRRHSVDRPPKWVQSLLEKGTDETDGDPDPIGMAAESATEPVIQADESTSEPADVPDESTCEPDLMADESVCEPDTRADESSDEPAHKVDESVGDPTSNLSFHFNLGDDCEEHETLGDLGWEDQDEVDEMSDRETTRQNRRYPLRRRVQAPTRLMRVTDESSGLAFLREGSDVAEMLN